LVCETGNSPSRLVDRLVAQGLVQRAIDPDDRRYVTLELTADGSLLNGRIAEVEKQLYATIDSHVAGQPFDAALSTLRALAAAFPAGQAVARRSIRSDGSEQPTRTSP
ncbi:MAG: MarR family winged helix-turn-helix transcriptional regulator, partial [Jiangellaceae bacterium]